MRNIFIILVSFGMLLSLLSCRHRLPEDTFSFDRVYYYAIQEDVKKIVDAVNSFNEDSLTDDQRELKKRYNTRFLTRSEEFVLRTNDSLLINVLTLFQNYWTEVLMKESTINSAEKRYRSLLTKLLHTYTRGSGQYQDQTDFENLLGIVLKDKGYYTRLGRTGNIMDLILWSSQAVKTYDVKIQDTVIKVPVVMIDSVLSYGWEGFATFDHFYPGGWTGPDTLFCITKDYDLNSEKFIVSYLTHETQHLYDAKRYSGYSRWMAEYRAKLAELSVADSTVYDLLGGFIKGNKNDRKLTHPYAEFTLITGLSKEIFGGGFVTDLTEWKKVPPSKINEISKKLLRENSLRLKKHG
jgi:hypothetical protein